jgi:hypothetical protein
MRGAVISEQTKLNLGRRPSFLPASLLGVNGTKRKMSSTTIGFVLGVARQINLYSGNKNHHLTRKAILPMRIGGFLVEALAIGQPSLGRWAKACCRWGQLRKYAPLPPPALPGQQE